MTYNGCFELHLSHPARLKEKGTFDWPGEQQAQIHCHEETPSTYPMYPGQCAFAFLDPACPQASNQKLKRKVNLKTDAEAETRLGKRLDASVRSVVF